MPAQSERNRFLISVDGSGVSAEPGQTVAAALIAAGITVFRHTASGSPRGVFCGMGVCFDCLVTIEDAPDQRACMTLATPGMRVRTGATVSHPFEESRVGG